MRKTVLFAGLLWFLPSLALAQGSSKEQIDSLVRKLGSSVYKQREQARKDLEAVGPAALDALRKSASSADAETARRIGDLIRHLEEQLATQKILAPKVVRLRLDDVTV